MSEAINEGKALRDQDSEEEIQNKERDEVSQEEKDDILDEAMNEEDFEIPEDKE